MKALSWVGFSVLLVAGVATASPKWQQLQSPPAAKQIWGSGPTDLYAVGASALYHSSDRGASWSAVAGVGGVHGVWGTSPNDVWAISDRSVSHSIDGGGAVWTPKTLDTLGFAAVMEGMWGSSTSELYVFGGDRASDEVFHAAILHSRDGGATWTRETVPGDTTSITAMWGSTASDVYAVGKQGAILHSTGSGTWQVQRTASAGLSGVWGSSATDVYAVGARGLILNSADHGKTWRERTSGVSYTLSSVYGVGAHEIFVGSTEGPPLRSTDGRTFRRMTGLVARGQVWAADAEHVFVCEKTGIAYYGEAANQVAGTVKPALELTSESTPALPRAQLLPDPGL
jgi:photosystem II stability/assembly factor-like uncharacterized protein